MFRFTFANMCVKVLCVAYTQKYCTHFSTKPVRMHALFSWYYDYNYDYDLVASETAMFLRVGMALTNNQILIAQVAIKTKRS